MYLTLLPSDTMIYICNVIFIVASIDDEIRLAFHVEAMTIVAHLNPRILGHLRRIGC
jgi:hypothetical protein